MFYWVYKDTAGYWRWTYYAANNKKIADGSEGYVNKADCLHGIALVKGSANSPVREAS